MVDMGCMESSTIALIIRYFNIVSTVIMASFATYGLIIIVRKKYSAKFLSAFCVASLLAFAVETVFFNYKHYLKWFAGEEFSVTGISPDNSVIGISSENSVEISDHSVIAEGKIYTGVYAKNSSYNGASIVLKNLNRKVTSVFIQPIFNKHEQLETHIGWADEVNNRTFCLWNFKRTLYKALPRENHIAVQTCGKVSELEILFSDKLLFEEISQIVVNKQIPFYFSGLRLFVVSLLFFAIILLIYKPLRVKAAYYLFEYKFDSANGKQTLTYVCLVILTIFFSWFCDYTTTGTRDGENTPMGHLYNGYLVDALIAGRTNIDYGHPERLLDAERPYDRQWLRSNGYEGKVDFNADVSWYKGKYYVYYGVVPAVLLYLPYKFITGNYLSHHAGIFVFASIAVIFLALLWSFLVKKYMPDARFAFVALSFLALFSVSNFFANIRSPSMHTVVASAGVAFLAAGTFLLLKSVDRENINLLQLFFACLCFALSVGCRPNMVLASILVPAVLWKRRSWKYAPYILIPYVIVAVPLCVYNYVRFDSIFEFGFKYAIGIGGGPAAGLLNPFGKIHRMLITFIYYLFRPYKYSLYFPFVELVEPRGLITYDENGFLWCYNQGGGLINFPILFCLFYLFKNILHKDKPGGFYLSSVFLVIAVSTIALYSNIGIFHGRYLLDCAVFFALPSLFCAYYWCTDKQRIMVDRVVGGGDMSQSAARPLKIVYVLLAASIFVGLFRFVTGSDHLDNARYHDTALYRYLEYSLGIIKKL